MTALRCRTRSLEILEDRRLMAADVVAPLPLESLEASATVAVKTATESGAVAVDYSAAAMPASALAVGAPRPASSASPAAQDAAFADHLPGPVAVELENCLISNWSHSGAGAAYELDRAFVKSWSTSGDADDRSGDDINIGVGELQETTISKSMDMAAPKLAQFAINGNSPSTSAADDRPTEEVSFYYNKIAFNH